VIRISRLRFHPDSPAEVAKGIFSSADALNLRKHFRYFDRDIYDDHVPLNRIARPTIDLIDFDYVYWHTADDTIDSSVGEPAENRCSHPHYLKQALAK
jgi:hypothetical protein